MANGGEGAIGMSNVWMVLDREAEPTNQQRMPLSPIFFSDDEDDDFIGFSEESFKIDFSRVPSLEASAAATAKIASAETSRNETLQRVEQLNLRANLRAKQFMRLCDYSIATPNSTVCGGGGSPMSLYEEPRGLISAKKTTFRQPFSPALARQPFAKQKPIESPTAAGISLPSPVPVAQQPAVEEAEKSVNMDDVQSTRISATSSLASWLEFNTTKPYRTLSSGSTSAGESPVGGPWSKPTMINNSHLARRSSECGSWFNLRVDKQYSTLSSSLSSAAGESSNFRQWKTPIFSPPSQIPQQQLPHGPVNHVNVLANANPQSARRSSDSGSSSFNFHVNYNNFSSFLSSTGDSLDLDLFEMPAVPEAATHIFDFEIPVDWIRSRTGLVQCTNCKLIFRRLAAFNGHIRQNPQCQDDGAAKQASAKRPTGNRQIVKHICSVCDKDFASRAQLRNHGNIHLRRKSYVVSARKLV